MEHNRNFYTELAVWYDEIFPLNTAAAALIRTIEPSSESRRLLDIGCGTGSLAVELSRCFEQVTGIDLDGEMIRRAEIRGENFENTEFHEMNMMDISQEFGTEQFGTALCLGNTIAHLLTDRELSEFFSAAYRVLTPGGVFVLQSLNYDKILDTPLENFPLITTETITFIRQYDHKAAAPLLAFNTQIKTREGETFTGSTVHNPVRPDRFRALLEQNGFTDIELFGGFDRSPARIEALPLVLIGKKPGSGTE